MAKTNTGKIDVSQLSADQRRELMRELASQAPVSLKVSEKGAVSVYGLGRFPVTLYRGQMEKLLNSGDDIRQFIADNEDALSVK
jgi:hypothetical protein